MSGVHIPQVCFRPGGVLASCLVVCLKCIPHAPLLSYGSELNPVASSFQRSRTSTVESHHYKPICTGTPDLPPRPSSALALSSWLAPGRWLGARAATQDPKPCRRRPNAAFSASPDPQDAFQAMHDAVLAPDPGRYPAFCSAARSSSPDTPAFGRSTRAHTSRRRAGGLHPGQGLKSGAAAGSPGWPGSPQAAAVSACAAAATGGGGAWDAGVWTSTDTGMAYGLVI